ncbi:MAG: VOC family protein [Alphaproteobacteria bacterium]|nr:VOC family protein [Alphaproteobacteria bacterium]
MIGYVTIGTNDFERALEFYDALLATIGVKRLWSHGSMAAWGPSRQEVALCLVKPHDGNPASVGNGVMVALKVGDPQQVDAVYAKAIALGGRDEGKPGSRGTTGFYGGYFRDLDGNKWNAYVPG